MKKIKRMLDEDFIDKHCDRLIADDRVFDDEYMHTYEEVEEGLRVWTKSRKVKRL